MLLGLLPAIALAADVIKTDGFGTCGGDGSINVQRLNVSYTRGANEITFDVAGESESEQKVIATLVLSAFGKELTRKEFDPCSPRIAQLCPVPKGKFSAQGTQSLLSQVVDKIPAIAFSIPDLDGNAKLELRSADDNKTVACIDSVVNNGKSVAVPAVSYAAAGIAGAALALSGLSALGAAGQPGTPSPNPTFGTIVLWFQGIAINGMHSVEYPSVYRSFARNFAFSGLLIEWDGMQRTIDSFRKATGGNLTDDSVQFLKDNATLVYTDLSKRLVARETFSFGGGSASNGSSASNSTDDDSKVPHFVKGIQGYTEQLAIPQANTFMTVLLIFAIVVAAVIVAILLFKLILEAWALFGTFPKRLTGFRKHYWWTMAKAVTNLIFLLYGVWTLYCIYQFTNGDSWAAKLLAGVTLGIFTAVLAFFTYKIWSGARKFKRAEGDVSAMYDDKEFWRKWSIFYENYKKGYWWLFIPAIVYMFAKGCVIAGADGHGLVQTAGQLIIESLMLALLLWTRPFSLKSGNWINIVIQVVRVLSVVCILIFVEELGISQTTKTITGVALIVTQSALTGVLALLLVINSLIVCCRKNPHRKRRKEAGKLPSPFCFSHLRTTPLTNSATEKNNRLADSTPLDSRSSLLLNPSEYKGASAITTDAAAAPPPLAQHPIFASSAFLGGRHGYDPVPNPYDQAGHNGHARQQSRDLLLGDVGGMGGGGGHSRSSSLLDRGHSRSRSDSPVDLGRGHDGRVEPPEYQYWPGHRF
ncbi:MAG: hypothetical protein INR71_04545 [Terriglobus roseus]|nr:hypothetical protein [Terriglobus roseus]